LYKGKNATYSAVLMYTRFEN